METSYLLAQLFGLIFLFSGLLIFVRRDVIRLFALRLIERPTALFGAGVVIFIVGLLIVLSHNVWDTLWQGIISLIAWLMVIKGFVYMTMPSKAYKGMIRRYYSSAWLSVGAVVMVVIGIYLIVVGFGI